MHILQIGPHQGASQTRSLRSLTCRQTTHLNVPASCPAFLIHSIRSRGGRAAARVAAAFLARSGPSCRL